MERKVDYVIKLKTDELKYDVKFDTWRKEVFTGADTAYDDDSAEDWLARQIDSAVADIESTLAWAVCRRTQGKAQTDALDEVPKEWVIHLQFAPSWAGSIRALNSLAHRYAVAKVLYRWYLASDLRQQAGDQLEESDKLLDDIYCNARSERVKLEPWRL
jgi:hypothetical protein